MALVDSKVLHHCAALGATSAAVRGSLATRIVLAAISFAVLLA